MITSFLASPVLIAIASAIVGGSATALVYLSGRFSSLPAVKDIKADWPVINSFLQVASATLPNESLIGLVADAAYSLWSERGLTPAEAQKYAAAATQHWKMSKYYTTQFEKLDQDAVATGRRLAEKLLLPNQEAA